MAHGKSADALAGGSGNGSRPWLRAWRTRPRKRSGHSKRITAGKVFRGFLLPFVVAVLAVFGLVDLAGSLARMGDWNDPFLEESRKRYLASIEESLTADLSPATVSEDPTQRPLPERFRGGVEFLLEHGDERQVALAKIAQREDWEWVGYALRQSQAEAVAEVVRLTTLEGHGLYANGDFEGAAKAYRRALVFRPEDPVLLRDAALATIHVQEGDPAAHWQQARDLLQQAIDATPGHSKARCALLDQMGLAWLERRTGAAAENIRAAMAAINAALHTRVCARDREIRAKLQDSLGQAWLKMPEDDPVENLQLAIAAFESAGDLAAYSRNKQPLEWAVIQIHLGNTWLALADKQPASRQSSQFAAYRTLQKAISALDPERYPLEWAKAQNSLGLALGGLSTGNVQNHRKLAIASFEKAGKVYLKTSHRADWARTRLNAANTLRHLAEAGGKNCSGVWQAMAYLKSVFRDELPDHLRTPLEPEVQESREALFGAWQSQGCGDPETLAEVPAAN